MKNVNGGLELARTIKLKEISRPWRGLDWNVKYSNIFLITSLNHFRENMSIWTTINKKAFPINLKVLKKLYSTSIGFAVSWVITCRSLLAFCKRRTHYYNTRSQDGITIFVQVYVFRTVSIINRTSLSPTFPQNSNTLKKHFDCYYPLLI